MKIYQVALQKDGRPPFRPDDELHTESKSDEKKNDKSDVEGKPQGATSRISPEKRGANFESVYENCC